MNLVATARDVYRRPGFLHIGCVRAMRTNIEIDDRLMAEAMAATGLRTKRETVEAALRLLARRARQAEAIDLFGRVDWRGDLEAERRDDAPPAAPGGPGEAARR